jgi:hypothetical protein
VADRAQVAAAPRAPDRLLVLYAVVVLANYVAQVPYALDLYGSRVSLIGATLLLATLGWFLVGLTLAVRRARIGSIVLLAYAAAQVAFYGATDLLGTLFGAGIPYQLLHARDAIVCMAFVAGDFSLVASLLWLVAAARSWLRRSPPTGLGSNVGHDR